MGGEKILAVVLAGIFLTGFAPPQNKREPAQQTPPKSWIPEQKSEPPVATPVDPPSRPDVGGAPQSKSSAAELSHPSGISCDGKQRQSEPARAARQFVEGYAGAQAMLSQGRFEDALRMAESAAAHAQDARQWAGIEFIRVLALTPLGDDARLVPTLESLIALNCGPSEIDQLQQRLDAARKRLNPPSSP